jgi:hypothetical protein
MPRPHLPGSNERGPIQPQCVDRGTTDGGATHDSREISTPTKMVVPAISARVEEANRFSGVNVRRFNACVFEVIAPETAPAKIPKVVRATQ